MRTKSILVLLAYLVLSVTVYADITVFDSNTTISDGDSYDQVLIKGDYTVVTMTGGTVFQVRTMDSATFNMTGGSAVISGGLRSYDTSTLNLSSGSIGATIMALGEGTVNCSGNINLSELRAYNSSRLNISDDAYIAYTLECKHNSTVEITGGTIGNTVSVESESENVHISISGGIITAIKSSSGAAISNEIGIVGYNLSKVPISSESSGEVTGNWNDDTPFSIPFIGEYPYPLVVLYDGIIPANCIKKPESDLNDDCKVNLVDLSKVASEWLDCGLDPQSACWE